MSRKTPILVTASVLVEAPEDIAASEELTQHIADQIGEALDRTFSGSSIIKNTNTYSFHWLADPGTNAEPCAECGEWTTDRESQNPICGLQEGTKQNCRLVCDQCRSSGNASL